MGNAVGTAYYMSPEVINGCYTKSCDIWSIGIVTYILLAGYPPFNGSNDDEIYNSTRRCNLIFERKVWGGLSHMSRDFVRRLLSKDASLRSTAEEALQLFLKKREKMMMMFISCTVLYIYLFRVSVNDV